MKYDDYEKVECNNYPNENITVELGRRPKKLKGLKGFDGKKAFDVAYTAAIFDCIFVFAYTIS